MHIQSFLTGIMRHVNQSVVLLFVRRSALSARLSLGGLAGALRITRNSCLTCTYTVNIQTPTYVHSCIHALLGHLPQGGVGYLK